MAENWLKAKSVFHCEIVLDHRNWDSIFIKTSHCFLLAIVYICFANVIVSALKLILLQEGSPVKFKSKCTRNT